MSSANGAGPPVRVLIVDDDPLVRLGLTAMLAAADGIEVVGEAGDGREVAAAVRASRPDVVLMDIRMAGTDGITATEVLRRDPHPPEVVVLTTFDGGEHVLRALRAGAAGFLVKDTPPERIVEAVRRVAAGEPILSPAAARRLIEAATDGRAAARRERARALLDRLSDTDRAVALAVGRGLSNAQIAASTFTTVPTVKGQVSRIMRALRVDNRVQVALLVHESQD